MTRDTSRTRIYSTPARRLWAAQSLPSALRAARIRRGLTQQALARKLGVTSREISKIERGAVDPPLSQLQDVSRLLDLELVLIPRQQISAVGALQAGGAAALKRPMYALGPGDVDDQGARVEEKFGYLRDAAPRRH